MRQGAARWQRLGRMSSLILFLSKIFQIVAQIDKAHKEQQQLGTNCRLLSLNLTSFMMIMTHVGVRRSVRRCVSRCVRVCVGVCLPVSVSSCRWGLGSVLFSIWLRNAVGCLGLRCLHKNSLHLVFTPPPPPPGLLQIESLHLHGDHLIPWHKCALCLRLSLSYPLWKSVLMFVRHN